MKIHFIKFLCVCVILHTTLYLSGQTCGCSGTYSFDYSVGSSQTPSKEYLSTSGLSTSLSNVSIHVCGRFVIDDNFLCNNVGIYMSPDAEIIVGSTNKLYIVGSQILGLCDEMWNRILVEDGAYLQAYSSSIYDSYNTAIELEAGATGYFLGNTFDRNHISIKIPNGTPNLLLTSNTFNANEFTLDFPDGKSGLNANFPLYAIESIKASSIVGVRGNAGALMDPNEFNGPFAIGIKTEKSILQSYNNSFNKIVRHFGGRDNGIGISALDKSVIVVGESKFDSVVFCLLFTSLSSGNIYQNEFNHYFWGVSGGFESPGYSSVTNNQFGTASSSGSTAVNVSGHGGKLHTILNTVYADSRDGFQQASFGTFGVRHSGESNNCLIKDNTVTLVYDELESGNGISLESNSNASILGNVVYVKNNTDNNRAIRLIGTKASKIQENQVSAESKGNNIGIYTENAYKTSYCCNEASNFQKGISFTGANDNSDIGTFNITDCEIGIDVAEKTTLGLQYFKGNRWIGSFPTIGARNNNIDFYLIRASQFWVNDLDQQKGPGSHSPSAWFEENTFFDDASCDEIESCDEEGPYITDLDTLFVDGYLDTIMGEGYLWTIKQELYTKVNEVSGLYGENDDVDTWFDNQSGGVVETYNFKRDSILAIFEVPGSLQNSIDDDLDTLNVYFDQLALIDSAIVTDTFTNWANFSTIRIAKLEEIDSVYAEYVSGIDSIKAARKEAAEALIITNASLSIPDQPTKNEREYHNILLSTIGSAVDTFTTAQKDSLYNIAIQCPNEGGRAVYWAAALYAMVDDTVHFDFESNCNPVSQLTTPLRNPLDVSYGLSISPNPASDILHLNLSPESNASINSASIYDLKGTTMLNTGSLKGGNSIAISNIPPGIYVIRVLMEDGKVFTDKLMITR